MKRTLGKLGFFRALLTALALSALIALLFPGLAQAADPEELDSTPSSTEVAPAAESGAPEQTLPSSGASAVSTPAAAPLPQRAPAPAPAATVEIASFADLEPYLEIKTLTNDCLDSASREVLTLKPGNYKLAKDFQINPANPYFADKKQLVQYGLINIDDAVTFDGDGHTISFPAQDAFPLFGRVAADKFTITNLKLKYAGDVDGFPFAMELRGGSTLTDQGFVAASGKVENIEVSVAGNVKPLASLGKVRCSTNYAGNYQGVLSTGFTWFADDTNFDNLKIDVKGNIGSETAPESEDASAGAFGFTFHFGNTTPQRETNQIDGGKTWRELYVNRKPQVLEATGHLKNLNLQVGGSIQAVTKNAGYAAGIGFDLGEAWIDNAQINIVGDLKVDMQGGKGYRSGISAPLAAGISEEVQNFTNSQLQVKNIIFKSNPAISQKTGSSWNYTRVHGLADDNSKGNYLNVKNNTIKIAEKMQVESSMWILSSAGFMNSWNSDGENGVNDLQVYENNTYRVGEIELKGTGTGDIFYAGLAMKARTGKETNPAKKSPLPEVSAKNNQLTCGNFKIDNPKGDVDAQLMMYNLANAKGNSVTYGDISVSASNLDFSGLGHILNSEPEENFYPQLTADNHFKAGNINISAKTAGTVALMFGSQDKKQPAEKCSAQAKSFNVALTDPDAKEAAYIGGLTAFGQSDIKDSRIVVGDVKVASASQKNLYFGLGAARAQNNATHSGNTVFVDKNIEVNHAGFIYGGDYSGFLRDFSIKNSHLQVDGVQKVDSKGGSYGGFAGQINNTTVTDSSALLLNDYQPFVFLAKGGEINRVAHYINKAVPTYYSGLLGGHYGDQPMMVKNSTLLVEKDHADSPLFRTTNVAAGSENNYLTVVNDPASKLNRTAYRTAATKISEDGQEVEVMAKAGEPVGSIQIAKRSFQDKYWNAAVQDYQTGSAEVNFKYMVKDSSGAKLKVFALPAGIVTADASTGKLSDYFSRHAGIIAENGPAYDLLGINAFATPETPGQPGQPGQPGTPEQPGKPNPGKPSPQGDSQHMPPTGSYELLSLLLSGVLVLAGAGVAYSRKRDRQR